MGIHPAPSRVAVQAPVQAVKYTLQGQSVLQATEVDVVRPEQTGGGAQAMGSSGREISDLKRLTGGAEKRGGGVADLPAQLRPLGQGDEARHTPQSHHSQE